jgi:Phage Mu protein F like protein
MNEFSRDDYARAFNDYLRKGIPIRLHDKRGGPSDGYVWRTRGDGNVRPYHRKLDGHLFSWDDPEMPKPGEEFGCRCIAIPYVRGETEFAAHDLRPLPAPKNYWSASDFIRHFYDGGGKEVTLEAVGHLRATAEFYAYSSWTSGQSGDEGEGAFSRLSGQISDAARQIGEGPIKYSFEAT